MKFIISRQELSECVFRIQNIVAPKTPIPILTNFLIEAKDNRLILTATDLTVTVRCTAPANVIESGSTTIPARRFAQLLRELSATHLELTTNNKDITQIVANASTFKLNGLPKAEFPALADLSGALQFSIKQKELKEMFYRTAFAVSKEDNRYVLTGVYLQIAGGFALFVGTDGKRLARASIPVPLDPSVQAECIIPLKAVDEVIKNLKDSDDPVQVALLSDKVAIEAGDMLLVSKLLSGDYPDVDKVIPQKTTSSVQLHREELMSLLRQVSLFIPDSTHSVRFTFSPGELHLTANTIDIGEGKVHMPVNYDGPRFDIAFNPIYFLDILRHSKGETVGMGFSDSYNPGVIVDGDQKPVFAPSFPSPLFVLMPMRLHEEVEAAKV